MSIRFKLVESFRSAVEDFLAGLEKEGKVCKNALEPVPPVAGDKPTRSLRDYLRRLAKYMACSAGCFLYSLILIDRLVKYSGERADLWISNNFMLFKPFSMHRLFLTALVLAAKLNDDIYYINTYYARVGGVTQQELCLLEAHFLNMIEWDIYVSAEEYRRYESQLGCINNGDDDWLSGPTSCARSVGLSRTEYTENKSVGYTATIPSSVHSTVLVEVGSSAADPSIGSWHSDPGSMAGAIE
eukprot:Hpha_TRINITY_DN14890_c1_g1::TRINITY_DN14890_c1_g1_i2::g.169885::m.169885